MEIGRAPDLNRDVLTVVGEAKGRVAAAVEAAVVLNFAWNSKAFVLSMDGRTNGSSFSLKGTTVRPTIVLRIVIRTLMVTEK